MITLIITIRILQTFAEKLRQYFEAFGAVQDAVVMKDPVSRRSRGFGFITFEHTSYVDNALAQDVHTIDARKVTADKKYINLVVMSCIIRLRRSELFLETRCLAIHHRRNPQSPALLLSAL
jgi:hypothetical protein